MFSSQNQWYKSPGSSCSREKLKSKRDQKSNMPFPNKENQRGHEWVKEEQD